MQYLMKTIRLTRQDKLGSRENVLRHQKSRSRLRKGVGSIIVTFVLNSNSSSVQRLYTQWTDSVQNLVGDFVSRLRRKSRLVIFQHVRGHFFSKVMGLLCFSTRSFPSRGCAKPKAPQIWRVGITPPSNDSTKHTGFLCFAVHVNPHHIGPST